MKCFIDMIFRVFVTKSEKVTTNPTFPPRHTHLTHFKLFNLKSKLMKVQIEPQPSLHTS